MVSLTLPGRSFEIAPYDIEDMILAAPYVDAISALGRPKDFSGTLESLKNTAAVLYVGISKTDPDVTITDLVKMSFADQGVALAKAMQEVLSDFGFIPAGEVKAPVKRRKKAGA